MKTEIKITSVKEKCFNKYEVKIELKITNVPEDFTQNNIKNGFVWEVGDPNAIKNKTTLEAIVPNSFQITYKGTYFSSKAANECKFSATITAEYVKDIEEHLPFKLEVRPTKDNVSGDNGETGKGEVIRVYINSPNSEYQKEETSWGGSDFNYQTSPRKIKIQAKIDPLPAQPIKIYFRSVDPKDTSKVSIKPNWWRGAPAIGDNGDGKPDAGSLAIGAPSDQKDYPYGVFSTGTEAQPDPKDSEGNKVHVYAMTNATTGIAEVEFMVSDHLSGDNYYVLASRFAIPKSVTGQDCSMCKLGVQRTGLITAWKQLHILNYGMLQCAGANRKCDIASINTIYKEACIHFTEDFKGYKPHKTAQQIASIDTYLSTDLNITAPGDPNTISLVYIDDTTDPDIVGTNRKGVFNYDSATYGPVAVVIGGILSDPHNVAIAARLASHEIGHGFRFKSNVYYDFDDQGHDNNGAYDSSGNCILSGVSTGNNFCLKHIEAFRRVVLPCFDTTWQQEKDRK